MVHVFIVVKLQVFMYLSFEVFRVFQIVKSSILYSRLFTADRFLKTSAKSVQTSAEVSRKYYVLTNLSARTH